MKKKTCNNIGKNYRIESIFFLNIYSITVENVRFAREWYPSNNFGKSKGLKLYLKKYPSMGWKMFFYINSISRGK